MAEMTARPVPATAPPLLVTKMHPPPVRDHTVARGRLVDRLRAPPGVKLTVLAAPPGSGKSTLLAAWRDEQQHRPIAWLSLDGGDNDPVVLWSYVLASLRTAIPALDVRASPESVGAAGILDVLLPDLVNGLTSAGDAALVLDDFQQLSSPAARSGIRWLAEHAPASFQLVLATRHEPALSLPSLRAHGELLELRAAELGFTSAEADLLFNDRFRLGIDRKHVDELVERSEGWPAALYLAALSLRGTKDRDAFLRTFDGRSRDVVDFLVDEVLEAHDPATQTLMLRSSVLDRVTGPLCDAVLEAEGSTERLDALSRTNLFLLPLDARGDWYRFHQLFRQLLRVELEHREPDLAPTLHRRAFDWHRENGSIDAAIRHALAAGAFAEALDTIIAVAPAMMSAGRNATVTAWLDEFPAQLHHDEPRLRLMKSDLDAHARKESVGSRPGTRLSDRELVVLRMLGGHLSEREIGRELYLSHNTVHSHTTSIFRKLGVSSRRRAVMRARELGLI
jgi:LuxR family transcriptional regulator, maltose regulon positive regulatory protein